MLLRRAREFDLRLWRPSVQEFRNGEMRNLGVGYLDRRFAHSLLSVNTGWHPSDQFS